MTQQLSVNYIMSYSAKLQAIRNILDNDTDPNKPKRLLEKGRPTKKAIQYNRKLIREGRTNQYIVRNKIYNPNTLREIEAYTPTGRLKAKVKRDFEIYGDIGIKKGNTKITKLVMPNLQDVQLTWDNSIALNNNYLLKILTDGLNGNFRIIINANGQNIFDNSYNISQGWWSQNETDFQIGGSPPSYIWNSYKTENGEEQFYDEGTKITIIITKESVIPVAHYEQKYQKGAVNCLLTPIKDWFEQKIPTIKTKQSRMKYILDLQKIRDFIAQNLDGVLESEIKNICDELQIGITITQPFSNVKYLNESSMSRPKKVFNFLNTEPDHIDFLDDMDYTYNEKGFVKDFDAEPLTQEELNVKAREIIDANGFYVYTKNLYGYSSIRTLTEYYKLPNEFYDTVSDFEERTGLRYCGFDAIRYSDLAEFVNLGTHFNGTIDFVDTSKYEDIGKADDPPEGVEHIDMKKAYANFKNCKYYDGFCGKIQAFRKTDKAIYNGLYLIKNLDFSIACEKFKRINTELVWFENDNIYTKQELDCLDEHNVKYEIVMGAFGVQNFDFDFDSSMLDNVEEINITDDKTIRVPYYSKYCGVIASMKPYSNYYMDGTGKEKWLRTIQQNDFLKIYENDFDNEKRISYTKKHLYTKKHITAQITAYQRLSVLEQLKKMDFDKLIRLCCDGIYYYKHDFENRQDIVDNIDPIWSEKTKMTFKNNEHETYISQMINDTEDFDRVKRLTNEVAEYREDFKHEFFAGAGGTGKTYYNLYKDFGLIHPVYVAPSWKLASDMGKAYKEKTGQYLPTTVINRITQEPYMIQEGYIHKWNTYIIDEASMLSEAEKTLCFQYLPKTIFLGDLKYQLPPVFRSPDPKNHPDYYKQMTTDGFDNIQTFTEIHRFQCPLLKEVAELVRDKIRVNYDYKTLPHFQKINKDKVKELYKREDIILVSQNKYNDEYNKMFPDMIKYRVKSNYTKYKNGEIIYENLATVPQKEFRHGFTVHSVQGLTFENKIFIDLRGIKSNKMFYTAISRARKLSQIYLII